MKPALEWVDATHIYCFLVQTIPSTHQNAAPGAKSAIYHCLVKEFCDDDDDDDDDDDGECMRT